MPPQDANPTPSFGGFGLNKLPDSPLTTRQLLAPIRRRRIGLLGGLKHLGTVCGASARRRVFPVTGRSARYP